MRNIEKSATQYYDVYRFIYENYFIDCLLEVMEDMNEQIKCDFLRKRMIELREKNHKLQSEMAKLICCNKSVLSAILTLHNDWNDKWFTLQAFVQEIG